ncbi:MAG: nitroreductase family protein [Candidatus Thermoplasmatota archaeon]|nr:nitroreductase family protein [Candidatus Thermoplasmatota archaeon]
MRYREESGMEVFDAVRARKSVRGYSSTPVPKEKLDKILESGRLAPSAMNLQPWHFIVVQDAGKREEMSKARYAKFLKESPVVIVGCGDRKSSPEWFVVDTTIALQNMVLTATSEGLGTCWIGSFDEEMIRKLLKIPEHLAIVALLAVGYPRKKLDIAATIVESGNRRPAEEIVSVEEYGAKDER